MPGAIYKKQEVNREPPRAPRFFFELLGASLPYLSDARSRLTSVPALMALVQSSAGRLFRRWYLSSSKGVRMVSPLEASMRDSSFLEGP